MKLGRSPVVGVSNLFQSIVVEKKEACANRDESDHAKDEEDLDHFGEQPDACGCRQQ
jgi:hypothetical protein